MRMKFSVHTVSGALLRGGNVESREVSPMQVIDPTQRQSPVTNKDGSDLKAYELRRGSAAYRFARKNEPHLTLRHTPGRKNSYGNVTDDLNHLIGCVGRLRHGVLGFLVITHSPLPCWPRKIPAI